MKKLFCFSTFVLGSYLHQAQESYAMFETMYIDVKPDKINEFEAAFKAHTDDWNAVMPYIKRVSEVEYWRQDKDLIYAPENGSSRKYHLRYFDVKNGKWKEVSEFLGEKPQCPGGSHRRHGRRTPGGSA